MRIQKDPLFICKLCCRLLVFESDQFSTYALTYNDTGTSTPDTSDNCLIMSFIVLTVLSGLCLLVIKRKSELEK